MTPVLVRHDGIQMPLDTFIDAYRMTRVDPDKLPRLDRDTRLLTVDPCGCVEADRRAGEIDLHSVAAFRALDGQPHHDPCVFCGTSDDECDVCSDCGDDDWGCY